MPGAAAGDKIKDSVGERKRGQSDGAGSSLVAESAAAAAVEIGSKGRNFRSMTAIGLGGQSLAEEDGSHVPEI